MVLPIRKFPDPILRKPTEPVSFPLSKEIVKLTRDMIDTVQKADGIGLAAPQVGMSVKVIVINLEKNGVPVMALYNPKVVTRSIKKIDIEEGCLSIPDVFGMVRRPKKVTIEAQNMDGEMVRFSDDGWIARVVQHEIDHTNGILILDHIKDKGYTKGKELAEHWKEQKLI